MINSVPSICHLPGQNMTDIGTPKALLEKSKSKEVKNMLYIGIDWASKSHAICITNNSGDTVKSFKIDDTYDGYVTLLATLRALSPSIGDFLFAIEDKNLKIVDFLLSHSYNGFFVSPASMDSYRRRYSNNNAKSDVSDAFILANLLRTDLHTLKPIIKDSKFIRELSALLKDRDTFVRDRTRLTNRLIITLKEYYPEFLNFFEDPNGPTALDFLINYPTFKEASKLTYPSLYKFFTKRHFCQADRIKNIFSILHSPAIPVEDVIIITKSKKAQSLAKQIKQLHEIISTYEQKITAVFNTHPNSKIFSSLPNAGIILSAGLMCIFGDDEDKFSNSTEVQIVCGTAPVTVQSGENKFVKFRRGCNHFYRHILHCFSMNSVKASLWAKSYLKTKLNENKSMPHALRCLSYRWIRIIYSMWKNGTPYDEDFLLANFAKQFITVNLSKNSKNYFAVA